MHTARTSALYLISIAISCGGLPTNYEYQYAPGHEYAAKDYSFSYGVKDLHTGDVKNQWEKKTGDQVTGQYSVVEPDGSVRIVDYTVNGKSGFNAVVKHKGVSYHPQAKKSTSYHEIHMKNREKLDEIASYLPKPKEDHAELYEQTLLALKENEDAEDKIIDDKAIPSNHKTVYTTINEDTKEDVPSEYLKETIVTGLNHKDDESEIKTEPEKKIIYYLPESNEKTETSLKNEDVKYFYYADDDDSGDLNGDKKGEKEKTTYYFTGDSYPEYYKDHGLPRQQTKPKYEKIQTLALQENLKPLPIDLSLLNPSLSGKDVSLEVDQVKPVVIDLSNKHPSYSSKFKAPIIENGFKPVASKFSKPTPEISNTFVTNVHPKTTPGLINYAGGHYSGSSQAFKGPIYRGPTGNKNGPVQFPNNRESGKEKVRRNPHPGGNRRPKLMKLITYYH